MAEGASSRADSQASLTSSVAKKRVFPGDYQRRLPGLVMTDFGDFLQTCLKGDICRFNDFYSAWREHDFALLYSCGLPALHVNQLIDGFHSYLQGLFVSESDTQIRVLLLFAIYVLYASQPYQEEAIRKPIAVSWDTFSTMKVFYRDVLLTGSSGSYRDAAQIFYHRLLRRNAFQLHLTMPASTSTTAMPMAKGMIDMDSLGGAAVRVQSLAHTPTLDDLTEVQQREAAYEELLAQFMPALEGQHRPHFVTHLQLCESPSRTRAKKTGKKARSKSMERQRAASASAIPPPQRPSTAPPFGRPRSASGGDFLATENNARLGVRPEPNSRSVSPLDYLAMDVDMPDFSSFLQ